MSYLESLFVKYGTDKGVLGGNGWSYTPYYEEAMEKRRLRVKKVLEIGICGYRDIPNNVVGASLFVWRDFFPNAEIYGIDNDGRFIFNDQNRIHTAQCDAYNRRELMTALESMGVTSNDFDMIVDDAVHDPAPQVQLATTLIPFLKPGGRYFIEDVCPGKMYPPTHEFFTARLKQTGISSVASCVTPKPEELVILVK